jgi:hypothetical protein
MLTTSDDTNNIVEQCPQLHDIDCLEDITVHVGRVLKKRLVSVVATTDAAVQLSMSKAHEERKLKHTKQKRILD